MDNQKKKRERRKEMNKQIIILKMPSALTTELTSVEMISYASISIFLI